MKYSYSAKIPASLIALTLLSGVAFAQTTKVDLGKREFDSSCAVCHGTSGKGNGPYLEMLRRSPPDLTTLAKSNGGVFPMNRVYESIEGANIASHGTRDMPIWGNDYRIQAAEYYFDVPYNPEAYVRSRVLALVEYINRLQVR
ncbi:MAG: c-type cytochrome [Rhodoferax sp.]|uniref:c-type cytochrome n=1 Tax=Rhodoferax sp. TaxID=50421 RepID=UPI002725F4B2|nr:c-type cytochrome [Rhodoferax sp.]MDO8448346.1 c-type cytochrome [Rhodoferax sp.]